MRKHFFCYFMLVFSSAVAETKYNFEKELRELQFEKIQNFFYIAIIIIIILVFGILFFYMLKRTKIYKAEIENAKQKQSEAEQQINQKTYEVEKLSKDLMNANLQVIQKNKLLGKISKHTEDNSLKSTIKRELKFDESYENFSQLFVNINPNFYRQLEAKAAPKKLSNLDLKYSAYISMKFSNKELAKKLNVGYTTVLTQKARLKNKLNLKKEDNFDNFLRNLLDNS